MPCQKLVVPKQNCIYLRNHIVKVKIIPNSQWDFFIFNIFSEIPHNSLLLEFVSGKVQIVTNFNLKRRFFKILFLQIRIKIIFKTCRLMTKSCGCKSNYNSSRNSLSKILYYNYFLNFPFPN